MPKVLIVEDEPDMVRGLTARTLCLASSCEPDIRPVIRHV